MKEYYIQRIKSDLYALPYINFDSERCIDPILRILSVDISISDSFDESSHLGLLQSNFVREKLQEYPVLKPVWLMLKKLLVINKLNNPYIGGLGSFSLFLMLYAVFVLEVLHRYEDFQYDNIYPARLFIWFLWYFSEYFNYKSLAIKFDENLFPTISPKLYWGVKNIQDLSTLWVYDPLDERNNTSSKVFKIENIIELFLKTKHWIHQKYSKIFNSESLEEGEILTGVL